MMSSNVRQVAMLEYVAERRLMVFSSTVRNVVSHYWRVTGFLAIVVMLYGATARHAAAQGVDLTTTDWILRADDDAGTSFSGTRLVFTSQIADGQDFALEGYFIWTSDNGTSGTELFHGRLFPNNRVRLKGYDLIDPIGIINGLYGAEVTSDGSAIVNGRFGGFGGIPGRWSAIRLP